MKKVDSLLREYVSKTSDDNLKFLNSRLSQRLQGDLPEALDFLSTTPEVDRWLGSSKNAWELYDNLDVLGYSVEKECERREQR